MLPGIQKLSEGCVFWDLVVGRAATERNSFAALHGPQVGLE